MIFGIGNQLLHGPCNTVEYAKTSWKGKENPNLKEMYSNIFTRMQQSKTLT